MHGDTLTRPKIGSIIKYNNWHKEEMFFVLDILQKNNGDTKIKTVTVGTGKTDELIACTESLSCKTCWYSTWYYVEQNPSDTIDNPNYVLSP